MAQRGIGHQQLVVAGPQLFVQVLHLMASQQLFRHIIGNVDNPDGLVGSVVQGLVYEVDIAGFELAVVQQAGGDLTAHKRRSGAGHFPNKLGEALAT